MCFIQRLYCNRLKTNEEDLKRNSKNILQQIQVERLTASVVTFVVTVELIVLQGKMTDVAWRECQRSAWENHMLFPRQNVVIPA